MRFSLTGAAPSSRAPADRPRRRAAKRKTLFIIKSKSEGRGRARWRSEVGLAVLAAAHRVTGRNLGGNGVHQAMLRADARAFASSVTPEHYHSSAAYQELSAPDTMPTKGRKRMAALFAVARWHAQSSSTGTAVRMRNPLSVTSPHFSYWRVA